MACRINYKENPISDIRDAVEKKKFAFETFPDQTQEETATKFEMYRNIVTTELVSNNELAQGYHLDSSGKTMRYVWLDTKKLAFKGRVTDKSKAKFAKKKSKVIADQISNTPDNINKRELGTSVHKLAENIMNYYLNTFESDLIDKTGIIEKPDLIKLINSDKYLKDYYTTNGSLNDNFTKFSQGIKEVLEDAIKTQKNINPNGKFKVFTEQFIPNIRQNMGGTMDLFILYSDNTADLYDFKTIHIDDPSVLDDKGNINSHNWLPEYKLEDFNTQIPILVDMVLREGVKKVRKARVIPIHTQLKYKFKDHRSPGNNLTDSPKKIVISTKGSEYLTQIPLIAEDTGDENLNVAVQNSYILLNNLTTKLEKLEPGSLKYNVLKKRISALTKSISSIIVKNDFQNINKEFTSLVDKFTDKFHTLVDIDNKKIIVDGKEENNYKYLSLEQIKDLMDDVEIFIGIAQASTTYLKNLSTITEEDLLKAIEKTNAYLGSANSMLSSLKTKYMQRMLNKDDMEKLKDNTEIGIVTKLFDRFSELPNSIIQKAREYMSKANDTTRIEFQKFTKELKKVAGNLEEWGQSKGLNPFETYKFLINSETGDLYKELNKEVYDRLENAKAAKDDKVIDSIYTLKKDAEEIFKTKKENYKLKNNISDENNEDFQKWLKFNDPKELKYTNNAYKYYEIDFNKLKDSDFTSEYLYIKQNKALLDYYNFWTDSMSRFRDMYEFRNSYQKIPNNFIPWIKKSMLESYFTNGIFNDNNINDLIKNQMKINQEEKEINYSDNYNIIKGEIDPETGRAKREIPRMFINPLRNASGEIDGSLKSFDLNASMLTFAYSALNYNEMKKIEASVEALKDIMSYKEAGVNKLDTKGNKIKYAYNKIEARVYGKNLSEVDILEKMIDYHMYGIKVQEVNKTSQFLLKAKRYQQLKELGLSLMGPLVNVTGGKTNSYFEGVKGYYYTKKMLAKSTADRISTDKKTRELYFAVSAFFEPYQGKKVNDVSKQFKGNKILKKLNMDSMFTLWREGDEHIEQSVLYSMLQNYGIENDKIVRIGNKTGIKSLLDSTRIEGDNLIIDGLLDKDGNVNIDMYNKFRQTVLNINAAIKGSMNEEDMNLVNMSIVGNLAMGFKNWMPGLVNERFKGIFDSNTLSYNYVTDTVTQSRYAALITDIGLKDDDIKLTNFFYKIFTPSFFKFAADVLTFGAYKYKDINIDRAKTEFLDFKYKNINNPDIQNYSFEDFLDYKKGQIRALAVEVRAIGILISILAFLGGDWDDDDEKDYKETWLGRQTYRFFNRYRREMSSLVNPMDWESYFRSPLPISGLLIDFTKLISNTFDQTRDDVFGQNSPYDKTPRFYELHQWIPGYKLPVTLFEPFEEQKKSEY